MRRLSDRRLWGVFFPEQEHTSLARGQEFQGRRNRSWFDGCKVFPVPFGTPKAEEMERQEAYFRSIFFYRQPIHPRSVERWRNYVDYLPELIELFPE